MKTTSILILLGCALAPLVHAAPATKDSNARPHHSRQRPDPAQLAARMLERNDHNHDQALSADELTEALERLQARIKERRARRDNDCPNDPETDQASTPKSPASPEKPPTPEALAQIWIERHDANESGSLDQSELQAALKNFQAHQPKHRLGQP